MSFDEYGEPIKKKQPKEGFEEGIPVIQEPDPMPDVMAESVAKADTSPRSTRNVKDYATIYKEDEYEQRAPETKSVTFPSIDDEYRLPKDETTITEVTTSPEDQGYYLPPTTTINVPVEAPSKKELREQFGINIATSSKGVATSPALRQAKPINLDKMLRAKGVEGDITEIERLAKRGGFEKTMTGKLLIDAKRIEGQGLKGKVGAESARFTAGFTAAGEAIVRPETPDLWSLSGGLARRGFLGGSARIGKGEQAKGLLGTFGAEAAVQSRSDQFGPAFIVGGSAGEVAASIAAGKILFTGFRAGKAVIKVGKVGKIKSGFGKIKIPSILGKGGKFFLPGKKIRPKLTTDPTGKKMISAEEINRQFATKSKGLTKKEALLMSDIKPTPKKTIDQIIGWGKRPQTTVKESKQFRKILGKTLGKRTTIKTTKRTTTRRIVKKTKPKDDTFKEIRSSTGQVQLMKMKPQKQITKLKPTKEAKKLGMYGKAPEIKAKPLKLKQATKTKQKARKLGMYGKAPEIKAKPRITSSAITKAKLISEPITRASLQTKTNIYQITKPKTITATKPKTITTTKPKTRTLTKPRTITITKPKTITTTKPKTRTLTKPRTITITKPKTITVTKPITTTKPKTITTTKPKTITVTKPITTTKPKPITTTTPKIKIPKTPTTPTIPPIIPFRRPKGGLGGAKKKKKGKKGKKFTRINIGLAKGLKI